MFRIKRLNVKLFKYQKQSPGDVLTSEITAKYEEREKYLPIILANTLSLNAC